MTTLERIQDFLGQKRLVMVGVSHQPQDFSRTLFRELQAHGYEVVPVNPSVREIDGQPCFPTIREVQPPVSTVLLMTPPAATDTVVRDCADIGVERVWMHRGGGAGAVSPEAVRFCESHGISVIPGECPFMFLPRAGWFHQLHGWVRRITGAYPR
jgi:predicted CoA-binding protein